MMNSIASAELTRCRETAPAPLRQAWIDRDGKLISFHPIESGQLLKAKEALFWARIFYLSGIGYRVQ